MEKHEINVVWMHFLLFSLFTIQNLERKKASSLALIPHFSWYNRVMIVLSLPVLLTPFPLYFWSSQNPLFIWLHPWPTFFFSSFPHMACSPKAFALIIWQLFQSLRKKPHNTDPLVGLVVSRLPLPLSHPPQHKPLSSPLPTPSASGLLIPGDAARGSSLLRDTWRGFTCAPGEINPPRLSLSLTPQSTKTWCRFCAPNWRQKLWCAGKTTVLPPAVKWSGKCPSCQEGCKDEHGDGAWPAHVYMLRKYQLSLL